MAAYGALVSLMNIMDQIQIHPSLSTSFNKIHIESLSDTVGVLLDFIETHNYGGGTKEVADLEAEIASATHAAEDLIESHIVDQILAGSTQKNYASLPRAMCDLKQVKKDMDSIKENFIGRFKDLPCSTPPAASSTPVRKTTMVGFDDYLIQLMEKLTSQQSYQQVIPIIGMGGVGKTTLARNAFENLLIKQHFDVSAWATISQNYSVRELLLQLLSIQDQEGNKKLVDLNELELGEQLHKFLFYRRYLIVLDDMWGIDVWDEIKFFFPDNNNGSRIVLTTRLLQISHHFNSHYLTINLLDKDKSWNLFCQASFGEEGCPVELEKIGMKICENCKGLPLSIVVIGGFLRKSNKALEYWEGVARDTYSILSSEGGNQCMNILSLSYNHLPAQLKPCFLYMGIFAEDKEIRVSELIRLWVAEGFLRPNDVRRLEEVAKVYLKELVDRNLILVNRWGSNGKSRSCKIHDLIRELCLSVAEKEKFLCVLKLVGAPRAINKDRRIVIPESKFPLALDSASLVRSLICKGHRSLNLRLLRVLSVVENVRHIGFLEADLRSVNLRCLDLRFVGSHKQEHPSLHIPNKISLLWNLQTLKIKGIHAQIIAPSQLWEMVQLRHLLVDRLYIPDPPRNDLILPNLQTLGTAMDFQFSDEVCKRIPNIKKLRLVYGKFQRQRCDAASYYCPENLGRFHKLESLTLEFSYVNWRHMVLNMTLPSSLKKLTISGGNLYWEDLEMIGSLPNLEVLKLRAYSVIGSEWNPCEGGFCRLKYLEIYCTELSIWNADHFHFPVLEKLFLGLLGSLDEIPSGIGEITTLQTIRLYHCELHCTLSAVQILAEQQSLGNEDLHVEVEFHRDNDRELDKFCEMVEEEGFNGNNLIIKRVYLDS